MTENGPKVFDALWRKSYASPWNPWTLVEAMDNRKGRRFKKA